MTTESVSAAPGWYPDGYGAVRFFDGTAWTHHTQPVAQPVPATPLAPAAASFAPAAAPVETAPFYRHGWFLVDAVVLAAIVLLIVIASVT